MAAFRAEEEALIEDYSLRESLSHLEKMPDGPGKYELMQDGDCICRFVLHPEGHFEWWQSRLFRNEDEEKTAGKAQGDRALR